MNAKFAIYNISYKRENVNNLVISDFFHSIINLQHQIYVSLVMKNVKNVRIHPHNASHVFLKVIKIYPHYAKNV
jgi:hypothetical protein